MSTAVGLSAVTAVLETLLNSVYTGSGLGTITVSAVAPDIVQTAVGTTADSHLQVNLFLNQVAMNPAWLSIGFHALIPDGKTVLTDPRLPSHLSCLFTPSSSPTC